MRRWHRRSDVRNPTDELPVVELLVAPSLLMLTEPGNTVTGLSFRRDGVRTFSEHFATNQIGCFAQSACGQRVKWPILQSITPI